MYAIVRVSMGDGQMDAKRFFSETEKRTMFVLQKGLCTFCSTPLFGDMEADHIVPHSRGGPTVVENGQLLHNKCHIEKGRLSIVSELRNWQKLCSDLAVSRFEEGEGEFLAVAPVGSGKTRMATAVIERILPQTPSALVIVVAPSVQILIGWRRALSSWAGCSVSNSRLLDCVKVRRDPPLAMNYWLMTYSSLIGLAEAISVMSQNRPVVIIADEIHHKGQEKAWGEAARIAFEHAIFRLGMSATPFRPRGKISGWGYQSDGRLTVHYQLSRREAVQKHGEEEAVIRKLSFITVDAEAISSEKIVVDLASGDVIDIWEQEVSFDEPDQADAALSAFIRDEQGILKSIKTAYAELESKRSSGFCDAGCLVNCADKKHAREVQKAIERLWPGSSVLAISKTDDEDDATAHHEIERFRKDNTGRLKFLVAVGMVNEGCDIPRLAVLCYLTNKTTLLYTEQICGRIVRRHPGDERCTGTVIMPNHPKLRWYAQNIMFLQAPEDKPDGPPGPPKPPPTTRTITNGITDDVFVQGIINPESVIFDDRSLILEAERVQVATGYPLDVVAAVISAHRKPDDPLLPKQEDNGDDRSIHWKKLRADLFSLAMELARIKYPDVPHNQKMPLVWRTLREKADPPVVQGDREYESFELEELQAMLDAGNDWKRGR